MKTEDKRALVYIHIFNNGVKYFGNAVDPARPYAFGGGRGKQYLEQYELDSNPTIEIIASGLTVEEADTLERRLFDEYIADGGLKIQNRPSGGDLARNVSRSAKVDPENLSKALLGNTIRRGARQSEVSRNKMSKAKSGKKNPNYGKSLSKSAKIELSKSHTGVPKSKEHREAVSAASNYKVISSLDGRITTHAVSSKWNKKNPAYIGTWSKLIPQ